jgi:hypothetical protein
MYIQMKKKDNSSYGETYRLKKNLSPSLDAKDVPLEKPGFTNQFSVTGWLMAARTYDTFPAPHYGRHKGSLVNEKKEKKIH